MANRHSNGSLRSKFDGFGYDGVFNLTAMTTSNHILGAFDGVHTWQYDSKDRLTQEVNDPPGENQPYDYTHAFGYDDAGNPTTFKGVTGGFNADNQQTSPGTFAYDGNGNPTTYKDASLTFDVENRMTSVQVGINAQSNGYRSDGLRAWKGWNVVLPQGENDAVALGTYFYYDGGFPALETNSSGTITAINVFAPDGLVARKVSGAWRHYQFDAQGSVMHRLRYDETVINNSKYDAYGMHVSMPFPVADAFGYNGRWGYYTDDETGLILCMHRYYDAANGRWLTRDPIGYDDAANLYSYCYDSPLMYIDALGTQAAAAALPVAGGAALADGPFPFGDVIGLLIIGGALAIDLLNCEPVHMARKRDHEHTKNSRPSSREKHEQGRSRRKKDWRRPGDGGEKGDKRRPYTLITPPPRDRAGSTRLVPVGGVYPKLLP